MQNFTEVDGIDPSGSVCQTKNRIKEILGLNSFSEILLKAFQSTSFVHCDFLRALLSELCK